MDVGGFLVITLDVVDVGVRRGLGMLEIEGCVARVRKRLRGWNGFCDFAQLICSLILSAPILSCRTKAGFLYMLHLSDAHRRLSSVCLD